MADIVKKHLHMYISFLYGKELRVSLFLKTLL